MMISFRALVRKDLQLFLSDRRAVLMSIVAPIVLASFFGFIFSGQSGKAERSRIAILVMDQDGSTTSHEIIARLKDEKTLEVKESTVDEARASLRKGKAIVAVLIPKDFGSNAGGALFGGGKKPDLSVLYDPSHGTEMSMVQGILTGDVMQVVTKEMFTGRSGQQRVTESLAQIEQRNDLPPAEKNSLRDLLRSVQKWNEQAESARASGLSGTPEGLTMPYETREEAVTAGADIPYNGYAHAFGGMGVQFILFLGIDVGIGVLLQRQRGLWKRFRAAPLSRGVLLGSRAISAAVIAAFIMLVLFAFARVAFGVHIEGSMVGFLGVCASFALMTAAFGLMIAALGKTPEATRGISILATLIMVMLGGSWVPTFLFPPWMQKLTVVVPTRWAVDGLDAMTWRGLGFSSALRPIGMLLLFSLLFGVLAVTRFRWDEES